MRCSSVVDNSAVDNSAGSLADNSVDSLVVESVGRLAIDFVVGCRTEGNLDPGSFLVRCLVAVHKVVGVSNLVVDCRTGGNKDHRILAIVLVDDWAIVPIGDLVIETSVCLGGARVSGIVGSLRKSQAFDFLALFAAQTLFHLILSGSFRYPSGV